MKELSLKNDRLAEVRKARKAAAAMTEALAANKERSISIEIKVGMPLPNFDENWKNQTVAHTELDASLRARLRANMTQALSEADRDLRAEEKQLCEEIVRLAAKTAAGGL